MDRLQRLFPDERAFRGCHRGSRRRVSGFGCAFVGNDPLDTETEYERVPVVMAEDFHLKHVGTVAGIIGGVVLLLGLVGLIFNLIS